MIVYVSDDGRRAVGATAAAPGMAVTVVDDPLYLYVWCSPAEAARHGWPGGVGDLSFVFTPPLWMLGAGVYQPGNCTCSPPSPLPPIPPEPPPPPPKIRRGKAATPDLFD